MSKFHNPIYEKDRWAANRSKAFLIAVLSVNSVITVIAIVVFMNMVSYIKTSSENDYAALLQLYLTLAMAECLMIVFIAPALAGTGISQERENGNLELFLSTGVSPWQVILGKLVSCMNMMFVLIVTSLPVFSLVFVYGGVQMRDLIAMISVLLVVALEICSLSILLSRCKSFSLRSTFCLCIKSDFDWRNIICSSCTEPFVQLISLWRSVGKSCILVSLSASY